MEVRTNIAFLTGKLISQLDQIITAGVLTKRVLLVLLKLI